MASKRDPKATAARNSKADRKRQRELFRKARNAEHDYARQLRKIARHVGDTVAVYAERGWVHTRLDELRESLKKYGEVLKPWARAVGARMLADVNRREQRAWIEKAAHMGSLVRREIQQSDVGAAMRRLLDEQVELITSIPTQAAERVHELATEGVSSGRRAEEIVGDIMRTGDVTRSRAELIARTETSRAATTLTEARSLALGSEGYIWRTAKDANVRDSHARMEGRFVRWSQPPTLDKLTGHAGALPNCRCYPEVVFRD